VQLVRVKEESPPFPLYWRRNVGRGFLNRFCISIAFAVSAVAWVAFWFGDRSIDAFFNNHRRRSWFLNRRRRRNFFIHNNRKRRNDSNFNFFFNFFIVLFLIGI